MSGENGSENEYTETQEKTNKSQISESETKEDKIVSRKEELMDDLSSGLIETFDASKDSSEIGRYIQLEFEDSNTVKKSQFELLGNLMEEKSSYTHELVIVNLAGEENFNTYSVGNIRLDMVKYKSIKKIFDDVNITITQNGEDSRMPYRIFKRLSSNQYLSENEIRDKYNELAIELGVEGIIKRNTRLY